MKLLGNTCEIQYNAGGMAETGHDIPLRKTTIGDRKTMNKIECTRWRNNILTAIPKNETDSK